jgi:hypothetical protein
VNDHTHLTKTTFAVLAASLVGGACSVILTALVFAERAGASEAPVLVLLGSALCFAMMVVAGIPWHLYASGRGWGGWRAYVVAGSIAGLACGSLILASGSAVLGLRIAAATGAAMAVGALSALTFWLIRRPDRDTK